MLDDRYLDLKQLSEYSSLSQSKLRQAMCEIPHARVGRKILVKKSDFDWWVRRHQRLHGRVSPLVKRLADRIVGIA